MTTHPPGMIALSCSENARYTLCTMSIGGIYKPAGSVIFTVPGLSIAENWNACARKFLGDESLQWLFLVNDDHLYPQDVLLRLLAHDKDVVTGLYVGKCIPFSPILYDAVSDAEGHVTRYPLEGYSDKPTTGLVPIVACGDGCMLVRRRVFEQIGDPWWSFGAIEHDLCDHDMSFCARIRAVGIELYADLDTVVDHVGSFALRPVQNADGSWSVQIRDRYSNHIEVQTTLSPAEARALLLKSETPA